MSDSSSGHASLLSSTINLTKTILGAAILSLPFIFGQTGQLLSSVLLIIGGVMQAFTLHLLAACVLDARGRGDEASFRTLANSAFGGGSVADMATEACNILMCVGFATCYLVVIGDLFPQIIRFGGVVGYPWDDRHFWITTIGVCILLPLMGFQQLNSLKVTSILGNAGITYIVIVVCAFACGVFALPAPAQEATVLPPLPSAYTSAPGMVESIPVFVSAYSCAQNVPTLVCELRDPTIRRVDIMILTAVGFCGTLFLVAGCCGSVAFGASVGGNLLLAFPNGHDTLAGLVATAARVAIVLNVIGSYPLFMHPARASLSQVIFNKAPSKLSYPVYVAVTGVLFLVTWGLSVAMKSLDVAIAFVGAGPGMLIGFCFPSFFYCRLVVEPADDVYEKMDEAYQHGHSNLKRAAHGMLAMSVAMIPVLILVQLYKIGSAG